MSLPDSPGSGGFAYRLGQLEQAVQHLDAAVEEQGRQIAKLEPLVEEVKNLRRAAYWVAGLIVTGAIGFAFSVLTVFGS